MGIFKNKKKNDDLSTLSEKDIQSKLYGNLGTENVSTPIPQAAPPSVTEEGSSFKLQPEQETDRDLFNQGRKAEEAPQSEKNEKIEEWVQEETETVEELTKETATPMAEVRQSSLATPTLKKKQSKKKAPLKKGKTIVAALLSVFQVVVGAVVGFFLLFDFRKPGVRKFAYVLLAGVFVLALIFAIHYLNIQRDRAMNAPSDAVAESQVSEADSSGAIPGSAQESNVASLSTATVASGADSSGAGTDVSLPEEGAGSGQDKTKEEAVVAHTVSSSSARSGYAIQVATYANVADADRIAKSLKDSGVNNAFVKPLRRSSGRVYHCVFIGAFENFKEADGSLKDFKKQEIAGPFQDAFVRNLK